MALAVKFDSTLNDLSGESSPSIIASRDCVQKMGAAKNVTAYFEPGLFIDLPIIYW